MLRNTPAAQYSNALRVVLMRFTDLVNSFSPAFTYSHVEGALKRDSESTSSMEGFLNYGEPATIFCCVASPAQDEPTQVADTPFKDPDAPLALPDRPADLSDLIIFCADAREVAPSSRVCYACRYVRTMYRPTLQGGASAGYASGNKLSSTTTKRPQLSLREQDLAVEVMMGTCASCPFTDFIGTCRDVIIPLLQAAGAVAPGQQAANIPRGASQREVCPLTDAAQVRKEFAAHLQANVDTLEEMWHNHTRNKAQQGARATVVDTAAIQQLLSSIVLLPQRIPQGGPGPPCCGQH